MNKQRLVGALDGTGHGCVISQDIPELTKGMVLVKVHASLISPGTELSGAKTARHEGKTDPGTPHAFGYQNAGEVLAVHDSVCRFKAGDRVACMGAGFAQHSNFVVVPQNLCCLLPDKVSYEQGAYAHLTVTSMQALRRATPAYGENLLVVGMGLVGQLAARLGQIAGTYVMGWDMSPFRLSVAQQWGINGVTQIGQDDFEAKAKEFTHGEGFDMAIMAFGGDGTSALEQVTKVMQLSPDGHRMGRIALVGGLKTQCAWGAGLGNLDLRCSARSGPGYHDAAWERGDVDYPAVFMRWTTQTHLKLALRYMAEGKINVDALTTHRLPLKDIDIAVTAHIEQPNATLGTVLLYED